MSLRLALILAALVSVPSHASATAEEEVVSAIRSHEAWPREVTYWYGPLEDVRVRDSSRIIFVKDDSGHVTHYIYREFGATDRIVRKVK